METDTIQKNGTNPEIRTWRGVQVLILTFLSAILCSNAMNVQTVSQIKITLVPSAQTVIALWGDGEATVDWGDGKSDKLVIQPVNREENGTYFAHIYTSGSGNYTASITGSNITGLEIKFDDATGKIENLDVSKCASLTRLYCRSCRLKTLDVSKNTALTELQCSNNQLKILDVSQNTALLELKCGSNKLTIVETDKNTALTYLECNDNKLTATALNNLFRNLHSNNLESKYIYIGGNQGTNTCDRSIAVTKGWTVF
jgi:hypothetical protein